MTRIGALLLLVALLAGAGAAPALPATQYKCCREGLLQKVTFFDAPDAVTSLQKCKDFCKNNNYGSPVFRSSSWGCASSKDYSCDSVPESFCGSNVSGYYRLYALSSLVTTREVVTRRTVGSDSGSVDTQTKDDGRTERDILGGTATDAFKKRGLDQLDLKVDRVNRLDRTTFTGQSRNFGGSGSTSLGGGLVNLGRSGNASIVTDIRNTSRDITEQRRISVVTDTGSRRTRDITGPGGRRDFFRRDDSGSVTTGGRNTDNTKVTQNLTKTVVDVRGSATINSNAPLLGGASKEVAKFGDLSTNLRATVIRGRGSEVIAGTSIRDIRRNGDSTTINLNEDKDGAALRRENTRSVGSTTQKSKTTGRSDTDTDRTRIDKAGVGSIDQTKNNTAGNRDNTTTTVDVTDKLTTINTTAECGNCVGVGSETIRKKDIKDTIVDAKSKFNDTKVTTTTSAGGKTLELSGQTRRQLNDTLEDTQTQGQQTSDRGGKSQKNCDKKTGVCQLVSENSGSTTTVSRNSSKIEDKLEAKKEVVTVASY